MKRGESAASRPSTSQRRLVFVTRLSLDMWPGQLGSTEACTSASVGSPVCSELSTRSIASQISEIVAGTRYDVRSPLDSRSPVTTSFDRTRILVGENPWTSLMTLSS